MCCNERLYVSYRDAKCDSTPIHSTVLHSMGWTCGTALLMSCMAWGYSARGELVQRALLVGLAVQPRRHENVLKRSSTCASTRSTNGLPPASTCR